jgi:hypothetical protein
MKLDREGLSRLLLIYPRTQLSKVLGVSVPALRRYIAGSEPQSEAIVSFMNTEIKRRLSRLPEEPVLVLMRYLNIYANSRLSLHEGRVGEVMRYPIISQDCKAAFWAQSKTLYVEASHLDQWLREETITGNPVLNLIVMENLMKMDILVGTERGDLLRGSGLTRQDSVNYVFDVSKPVADRLLAMLMESASREDPSQDGRVNIEGVIR